MSQEPTYTIEVTKAQAEVISTACELFARLRMGQFYDIVWKVFPDRMSEVNLSEIEKHLEVAGKLLRNKGSHESNDSERTEKSRRAWDLHQVIRYRLSWDDKPQGGTTVNFYEPLVTAQETLAQIQRKDP